MFCVSDCFEGTICRSGCKHDIMNSDEFILEVPAELRMRRKQRKKDDIISPILQDDFAGDYYGRRTIISKNRN